MDIAHWGVVAPDGEHRGQVEHAVEVDSGVVAGQLQLELEGPGQAYTLRRAPVELVVSQLCLERLNCWQSPTQ